MTAPTAVNVATGDAEVGIQAGIVFGGIHYQLPPNPSPEQVFRLGARYLAARMPTEARRHIEEAVARGYETDEVHFHRLLALLSGRTLRQLSSEEFDSLAAICASIDWLDAGDPWAVGLRAVLSLVNSLNVGDTEAVTREFAVVPVRQYDMILDHLGVLLEGAIQDQLWQRSVERAKAGQQARDRSNRIWIFFQPEPAHPRIRAVQPAAIPRSTWLAVVVATPAFLVTGGYVGRLVLRHSGTPWPVLAYLAAMAGVVAWLVLGAQWHFRRTRVQTKDAAFAVSHRRATQPPADGFTSKVHRYFGRYFAQYVPRDTNRSTWLEQTAGIRRQLQDELTEIYREQRIDADQIAWLIRHLVGDVRTRWEQGTLLTYRERLRTPAAVRLGCVAGLLAAAVGGLVVAPVAVAAAPGTGTASVVLAAAFAVIGVRSWFRIDSELRRVTADQASYDRRWAARQAAFERWQLKLARRPSDLDMALWLECDRRLLVDATLRHYRLKPSNVIAHAFIEAPGERNKHARVESGPWRYTRYKLLLFLLTDDGVRQVDIDLDFEHCRSGVRQRLNYRFDAVAAIQVNGVDTPKQTFELTLVNGKPIRVPVTDSATESIQPHENPAVIFRVALDASGLPRTLTVLEGIAAEGKSWIKHRRHRADARLPELRATIAKLLY